MAPARVVPAERAVIAVPRSDSTLVQLMDQALRDRPASFGGIDRIPQLRQLAHRNRVEADSVSGTSDLVRERGKQCLLPLAVLPLTLTVPDTEMHVVR